VVRMGCLPIGHDVDQGLGVGKPIDLELVVDLKAAVQKPSHSFDVA